jgi:hypothetical protein
MTLSQLIVNVTIDNLLKHNPNPLYKNIKVVPIAESERTSRTMRYYIHDGIMDRRIIFFIGTGTGARYLVSLEGELTVGLASFRRVDVDKHLLKMKTFLDQMFTDVLGITVAHFNISGYAK